MFAIGVVDRARQHDRCIAVDVRAADWTLELGVELDRCGGDRGGRLRGGEGVLWGR